MRRTWAFLLACVVACGGLAVACGDDDDGGGGGTDAGNETSNNETGTGDGGDGGDAGCTFASYVIGLVNTQTNATAQPDKGLGAGCADTTDQAAFKPLFP